MTNTTTTKQARIPGQNTETGKLKVRFNGVKHGISSRILNDEEQAAFDQHHDQLKADLNPMGYLEEKIVQGIAYTLWRRDKLYLWQEASTQAEIRQSLETEAYPNQMQRLIAQHEIELGVVHGSLAATLERLSIVLENSGLLKIPSRNLVDSLEDIKNLLPNLRDKAENEYESNLETSQQTMATHTRISQLVNRSEALLDETKQLHSIPPERALGLLIRYEGSLDRALYRALMELRAIQNHRLAIKKPGLKLEDEV
jgi:hypothetical protein